MITPQDIRDKTFEKAVFGGYDMGSVDDFLDKVAEDLAAANKEVTVLKAKMKVLVDKIEEYRANENALNMALLSAQKLSVQIEAEARHRAEVTVAEANAKADAVISSIAEKREEEERRLDEARHSAAEFIANMQKVCDKQLAQLDAISQGIGPVSGASAMDAAADTRAKIEDTVKIIGDSISRIPSQPAPAIDIEGIAAVADEEEADVEAPAAPLESPEEDTQLFVFDRG